jgi:sugar phosphate isomerase/epimerase
MTDENSERNDGIESDDGLLTSGRRSVLQGAAALGLGGSAVGSVAAQNDDESENAGNGDDQGEDESDDEDDEQEGTSVAIQLYTLRNLPDSTLDLVRRAGAVDNNGGPGYDAVETAGLGEASTDEMNTALEQTGLEAAAGHIGLGALQGDSFEETVETYTSIGVDTFVVPYISPDDIDTVEKVEALAEQMNEVAARLEDHDARLGFHNHDGEFQEIGDGTYPLEVFDETLAEGVIFEIDVGWVLTAGYDPAEIVREYSDRTELVHMKDMKDGEFYEIGEGDVDMAEVAEAARSEANVDYLIYEHDQPANPAGSVATGAGVLSFLDGRPGLECLDFEDVGGVDYDGSLGDRC